MGDIVFTETRPADRQEVHLRAELNGEVAERILFNWEIQNANFDLVAFVKKDMRDELQGTGIYARREG